MKQHRFIGPFDLTKTRMEVRGRALVHQVANVLKLRSGEEVVLGDGIGKQAVAILERVSSSSLGLQILSVASNENEPSAGVTRLCLLWRRRTVKRAVRMGRLCQIAKEAAEQSRRGIIPHIAEPMEFESAVSHAAGQERNFFFTVGASEIFLRGKPPFKTAGIFVGPEGGWEEREAASAQSVGFESVGLSSLTLRAETAAVVASYIVLHV